MGSRTKSQRQLGLFDNPRPRIGAPAQPVATSIAAAEAIAEIAPTLRGKVYQAIATTGDRGATRNELVESTGIKLQTICARVWELSGMGLIYQTDEARGGGKVLRARRC